MAVLFFFEASKGNHEHADILLRIPLSPVYLLFPGAQAKSNIIEAFLYRGSTILTVLRKLNDSLSQLSAFIMYSDYVHSPLSRETEYERCFSCEASRIYLICPTALRSPFIMLFIMTVDRGPHGVSEPVK